MYIIIFVFSSILLFNSVVVNKYCAASDEKIENINKDVIGKLNDSIDLISSDDEQLLPVQKYHGDQLWRIPIVEEHERTKVTELFTKFDGQPWMEIDNNIDVLLKLSSLKDAEQYLLSSNLTHVVLIDDLQEAIDSENPPKEEIENLQNRKGHRMTWIAYHRTTDIHGYLDYLAKTYPDICSTENIGFTAQARSLKLLKISNGNPKNRPVWIDGGMHAREWISTAVVTYIIERLTENWDDLPTEMKNIDWYILPLVNPDGYEHTHQRDRLWRKNLSKTRDAYCSGVDLNRNFGYAWGGQGTSTNSCSNIFRGPKPFSEPESKAMSTYMTRFGKNYFKAYLTYHSYGQYILYPWGHDKVRLSDYTEIDRIGKEGAAKILKISGSKYTVGNAATTLYPAAGGSDDWAKGTLGIKYTYTVELGDTGRHGFVLPAKFIEQNGKEGMAFVETIALAVSRLK